jgi:hypothetical protein
MTACAVIASTLLLAASALHAEEGPVWFWLSGCGGPDMAIEVRLDGKLLHKSVVPICRAVREDAAAQGQSSGRIEVRFTAPRAIVWEGYRDGPDRTKAGQELTLDIWQAGADPEDLLLGVDVMDGKAIHMNTLHIAHPFKRDRSEIASGLEVVTYRPEPNPG